MHEYGCIWSTYLRQPALLHWCFKCVRSSELRRCINASISLPWEELFKGQNSATAGFVKLILHDHVDEDILYDVMHVVHAVSYAAPLKYRDFDLYAPKHYGYAALVVIF